MPNTALGAGDTAVNLTDKDPYPHEAYILAGVSCLMSASPKQTIYRVHEGKKSAYFFTSFCPALKPMSKTTVPSGPKWGSVRAQLITESISEQRKPYFLGIKRHKPNRTVASDMSW